MNPCCPVSPTSTLPTASKHLQANSTKQFTTPRAADTCRVRGVLARPETYRARDLATSSMGLPAQTWPSQRFCFAQFPSQAGNQGFNQACCESPWLQGSGACKYASAQACLQEALTRPFANRKVCWVRPCCSCFVIPPAHPAGPCA